MTGHSHSNYVSTVAMTGTGNVVSVASISGNTITLDKGIQALTEHSPIATTAVTGLVSTTAQSFAGVKTFDGIVIGSATLSYNDGLVISF